jgi:serine/threonine protein kinase
MIILAGCQSDTHSVQENALIDRAGGNWVARVTDFGISHVPGLTGCTTASVGTQDYVAPELWDRFAQPQRPRTGAHTSKESDMFSLGILGLKVRRKSLSFDRRLK